MYLSKEKYQIFHDSDWVVAPFKKEQKKLEVIKNNTF